MVKFNDELYCQPGMWLPFLGEFEEHSLTDREVDGHDKIVWPRGLLMVLYLLGMLWSFAGVGIVADCFMAGIETVTSATYKIKSAGMDMDVKVSHETRRTRSCARINPHLL